MHARGVAAPAERAVPVMGVIAVQGAFALHLAAFRRLGVTALEVRTPEQLGLVDAVVIPGGESTTISMMLAFNGLVEPLQAALAAGMPALGTCAGMIVLARDIVDGRADQRSLAAIDLTVRRNAFGRQVDSFETDLVIDGLAGGPFPAVFIRAPSVVEVGPEVDVLARLEAQAGGDVVFVRQGDVFAAAFHPELSGDDRVHQLLVDTAAARRTTGSVAVASGRGAHRLT